MSDDDEKINQYLECFPIQMIELVGCLSSNKFKWAVYGALLENKRMYFNQIKDEFSANSNEIDRALKSLGAGGLVIKRAKNFADVKNDNRTYYEPSVLGEMFYDSMFNLVIPKKMGAKSGIGGITGQMPSIQQEILPIPLDVADQAMPFNSTSWRPSNILKDGKVEIPKNLAGVM